MHARIRGEVFVSLLISAACALAAAPQRAHADEPRVVLAPEPPSAYFARVPAPPTERAAALAEPAERAGLSQRTRAPRIGFETTGALIGIGASAIVGVFGWGLAGTTFCQSTESACATEGAVVSGALASLVLVPLGVLVGSRATRGNGGYLWSVLGAALGLVPAVAGSIWLTQETGEVLSAIPLLSALTMFGAVLGYELSADAPPTSTERLFTPVAFVDASSFRVGVRGSL